LLVILRKLGDAVWCLIMLLRTTELLRMNFFPCWGFEILPTTFLYCAYQLHTHSTVVQTVTYRKFNMGLTPQAPCFQAPRVTEP